MGNNGGWADVCIGGRKIWHLFISVEKVDDNDDNDDNDEMLSMQFVNQVINSIPIMAKLWKGVHLQISGGEVVKVVT